jgi:hypothetical protein
LAISPRLIALKRDKHGDQAEIPPHSYASEEEKDDLFQSPHSALIVERAVAGNFDQEHVVPLISVVRFLPPTLRSEVMQVSVADPPAARHERPFFLDHFRGPLLCPFYASENAQNMRRRRRSENALEGVRGQKTPDQLQVVRSVGGNRPLLRVARERDVLMITLSIQTHTYPFRSDEISGQINKIAATFIIGGYPRNKRVHNSAADHERVAKPSPFR